MVLYKPRDTALKPASGPPARICRYPAGSLRGGRCSRWRPVVEPFWYGGTPRPAGEAKSRRLGGRCPRGLGARARRCRPPAVMRPSFSLPSRWTLMGTPRRLGSFSTCGSGSLCDPRNLAVLGDLRYLGSERRSFGARHTPHRRCAGGDGWQRQRDRDLDPERHPANRPL